MGVFQLVHQFGEDAPCAFHISDPQAVLQSLQKVFNALPVLTALIWPHGWHLSPLHVLQTFAGKCRQILCDRLPQGFNEAVDFILGSVFGQRFHQLTLQIADILGHARQIAVFQTQGDIPKQLKQCLKVVFGPNIDEFVISVAQ